MNDPREEKAPHDVARELEFHLDMLTRRYMAAGLDERTAREKALARIGDLQSARHAAERELGAFVTRSAWVSTLWQDARYAFRLLRRAPLFTATALLTIAVGAGATTAIFSVVNAVLLRELPYPGAAGAMVIYNHYYGAGGIGKSAVAPEELADYRAGTTSFDHFAALRPQQSALTDGCSAGAGCEPERMTAYGVSPELFDLLGIAPARGRGFGRADGVVGANRVVLISDGVWKRRFGADEGIVGRVITLGGVARTIIGVMPEGMNFPDDPIGYVKDRADIWIPVNWHDRKDGRGNQYLVVIARRKPGVSVASAQADLLHLADDFKARFPDRYTEPKVRWRLGSSTLREEMVGDVREGLVFLFGAVGLVLLIACANVANLMVAKGALRSQELALRSALGAGRRRLVQQMLIETLVITGAGTALGIGVAAAGLEMLIALNPGGIPRLDAARIDGSVLAFASLLALVTSVIVGLLPAMRQSKTDPQGALSARTRGAGGGVPRRRLRHALVIGEVTLAVIVLVGALLLVRSFVALSRTPTGVSLNGTAIAHVSIPRATYDTPEKIFAFHRELAARLAALPGVTSASGVYPLPMSGEGWSGSVGIVGLPEGPGVPEPHTEYAVALPGYFRTAGIPLIAGRDFDERDIASAPQVAIVDQEFARQYWPGESALGKRIATSGDLEKGPFQTVIGVAAHTLRGGAREKGEAQLYLPSLQNAQLSLYYVANTRGDAGALLPAIRAAVREQDPRLPAKLTTGDDLTRRFLARDRFTVLLFTVFGLVALVLAGVGMYGVLASLVAQRTREIGIRLALGGQPAGVIRRLVGEGLGLAAVGLVLGLGGAALLSQTITTLLFQVEPTDAVSYTAIAAIVLGVSLAASYLPARRAARIDPVETLR
jgi:putative ABC transport system permease protein